VDLISDNRIVVSTYIQLAKDVDKMGAYADMMHMYALSAVLKEPIRSPLPDPDIKQKNPRGHEY
jgi:hypothetical protein